MYYNWSRNVKQWEIQCQGQELWSGQYLHCYIYKNVCQMARTMFYVHASKYGVFKNSWNHYPLTIIFI